VGGVSEDATAATTSRNRPFVGGVVYRKERCRMYGHSHSGIGSLVLTMVAFAKGGIGYLVKVMAHAQH
jgi:hypothetical protein